MGLSDVAKLLEEGIQQDLPPTMGNIPDDVLCVLLTYNGVGEICSTAQVNGRWHDALNSAEQEIILNVLQRYGPVLRCFSDCNIVGDVDEHKTPKEFLRRAYTVTKVSSQGKSLDMLSGGQTPLTLPAIPPPSLFAKASSAIDVEYRTGDFQPGSSFMSPYCIDGSFDCSISLTDKFLLNPSLSLRFSRNGKSTTFLRTNFVLKKLRNGMVFQPYSADIEEFEWHPFEDCQHIHIVTRGTLRYHHRLRDPERAQIVLKFRFDLRSGPDLFINLSSLELSRILEAMFD